MMKSPSEISMPRQIQDVTHAEKQVSHADSRSASVKCDLLGVSLDEWRALMKEAGEPAYRGSQLYHALYAERRFDFASMSSLPAALRQRLANDFRVGMPEISQRFRSSDESVRYLLKLPDTAGGPHRTQPPPPLEAVFMPSDGRQTICISTQAGCAVDCHFCLTAQLGLVRNLTAGEILAQALIALAEHRESLPPRTDLLPIRQREPALNYEPVMAGL